MKGVFIIKVSKKIKVIVSLIACTVMMMCSALPSLAYTYPDDYVAFVKSNFISSIEKQANISLSDYHYIINSDYSSTHTSNITFTCIIFSKEYDDIVCTSTRPDFGSAYGVNVNGVYGYFSTCGTDDLTKCVLNDKFFSTTVSHDTYYFTVSSVLYSNCNSVTVNNESKWEDSNAPIPFQTSYSRTLKAGMSREATQDGETVTVNTLDVCVQMTNDYKTYIEQSLMSDSETVGAGAGLAELIQNKKEKPLYTYQYLMFITTYDPNIYGTKKSMEHAIYTYLDNNKYVLTSSYGSTNYSSPGSLGAAAGLGQALDSSVEGDTDSISNVGEQTSQTSQGIGYNAYCEGVTPLFGLPLSGEYANHHTINLANIYGADDLTEQDILYIVVVGKRYLWETGAEGYASDFYSNNSQFKTFYNELPDNVISSVANDLNGNEVYDFYTTVSDGFSFKDYPAYTPLTIDGKEYPTNLPIANMLEKPFTPSNYTDYDGLESGTKFNSKDKFDEYINDKSVNDAIANNFANINYTDLGALFDVTGDYFKFLTAALSILPSWFLTIFTAWFVLFLGIALVKVALAIGNSVSGS